MITEQRHPSYVRRSMIKARPGEGPLFSIHPGIGVFAKLDGYAIIPREEYEALLRLTRQGQERPDCCLVE